MSTRILTNGGGVETLGCRGAVRNQSFDSSYASPPTNLIRSDSSESAEALSTRSKRGPRGGVYDPFPLKLHRMLDQTKADGLETIVSWLSHGRAFKIHKPKVFATDVMPNFFNQSKYTSFQRQLNLYGFSRCGRGVDSGAYYHELFLRGKPSLARGLLRTKVKGNGHKTMKVYEKDPDFHSMIPITGDNQKGFEPLRRTITGDNQKCFESLRRKPSPFTLAPLPPFLPMEHISGSQIFAAANSRSSIQIPVSPSTVFSSPAGMPTSTAFDTLQRSKIQTSSDAFGRTLAAIHQQPNQDSQFLQDLNQSIFIHELAVGCTILCQLRGETKL